MASPQTIRTPKEATRIGHLLPHTKSPSPPSTKPGPIAHLVQSNGQVRRVYYLTPPCTPDDPSIASPARRRKKSGWQYRFGQHAVHFPIQGIFPGSCLAFAQMPVSLEKLVQPDSIWKIRPIRILNLQHQLRYLPPSSCPGGVTQPANQFHLTATLLSSYAAWLWESCKAPVNEQRGLWVENVRQEISANHTISRSVWD